MQKGERKLSFFCVLGICTEIIGSVLPVRLSVGNRFAFLHDKSAERRGQERGAQGGAKLPPPPGGRGAAEAGAFGGANKPGGTPAHRRWVGAQQGGSEAPPAPGGREAAEAGAFGGANKPGETPAHRRWVGAQQGGRGAAEGRMFWRKEHSVLFSEKSRPEHRSIPKG